MKHSKEKNTNIVIIRIIAISLIVLGTAIGMSIGMTRQLDPETRTIFMILFKIYENLVRASAIILGVFFTIRYTLQTKGKLSRFRIISLISFSLMAFTFLIHEIAMQARNDVYKMGPKELGTVPNFRVNFNPIWNVECRDATPLTALNFLS